MLTLAWVLSTVIYIASSSNYLTCRTAIGSATAGSGGSSSDVSCNVGETMVSCGLVGTDNIGGSSGIVSGVCRVWDYSSGWAVKPAARCCTFPAWANPVVTTIESGSGTDVSVSCPADTVLTGCSYALVSGGANAAKGSFPGAVSDPSQQTASYTGTGNQCNAKGQSSVNVKAVATCISGAGLSCQAKSTYTNRAGFGACPSDYIMTSCSAFSSGGLDSYYVNANDQCYVQKDSHANQYASGVCCQVGESACTAAGLGLSEKAHQCQCQGSCGGDYCNSMEKVSRALRETVGDSLCGSGETCCCSCENCANYVSPNLS